MNKIEMYQKTTGKGVVAKFKFSSKTRNLDKMKTAMSMIMLQEDDVINKVIQLMTDKQIERFNKRMSEE